MKTTVLVIALAVVFVVKNTCAAQNLFFRYFEKLNTESSQPGKNAIYSANGKTLVFGISGNAFVNPNDSPFAATIIVLNKEGRPIFGKEYKCKYYVQMPVIATTVKDGGFVFAASLNDTTGVNKRVGYVAARCDRNGHLLWSKQVLTSSVRSSIEPYIIKETAGGGCVIESHFEQAAPPDGDKLHFIFFDKDGSLQKQYAINAFTNENNISLYLPSALTVTRDGELLLGGNKNCQECNGYPGANNASVIKLDKNGKVVYSKNIKKAVTEDLSIVKIYDSLGYNIAVGGNYRITFADTATSAKGVYIPDFNGYWLSYIGSHRYLLPFLFDVPYGGFYDEDLVYTSTLYGKSLNLPYYNNYVYRQDAYGRRCPDYTVVPRDSSTSPYLYSLVDKPATTIKIVATVTDLPLAESDYYQYSAFYCNDAPIAGNKR